MGVSANLRRARLAGDRPRGSAAAHLRGRPRRTSPLRRGARLDARSTNACSASSACAIWPRDDGRSGAGRSRARLARPEPPAAAVGWTQCRSPGQRRQRAPAFLPRLPAQGHRSRFRLPRPGLPQTVEAKPSGNSQSAGSAAADQPRLPPAPPPRGQRPCRDGPRPADDAMSMNAQALAATTAYTKRNVQEAAEALAEGGFVGSWGSARYTATTCPAPAGPDSSRSIRCRLRSTGPGPPWACGACSAGSAIPPTQGPQRVHAAQRRPHDARSGDRRPGPRRVPTSSRRRRRRISPAFETFVGSLVRNVLSVDLYASTNANIRSYGDRLRHRSSSGGS